VAQRLILILLGLLLFSAPLFAQVKREREESITDLVASNTMGFGNIWIRSQLLFESRYRSGSKFEPYQAIGLGMSQNISAWAGAVPFDGSLKKVLGKIDGHLKVTLPWNDNLRFLGVGVQGDMVLSNEQDTLGQGKDTSRPAFTPRLGVTVAVDADFIKLINSLPLKLYLNWSTTDNDRLLALYKQQSFRIGAEWKMERHSAFIGVRFGLYKRMTGIDSLDVRSAYDEKVVTLLPGVRYRPFDRASFLISAVIAAGGSIKKNTALDYGQYGLRLGFEMPIFYRETNTEAIRSMIFLERKKNTPESDANVSARSRKKEELSSLLILDDGKTGKELSKEFQAEDMLEQKNKEMKEKRKKINDELRNIEQLLE